nr:unnamed protein product [Naegleria fowleri]
MLSTMKTVVHYRRVPSFHWIIIVFLVGMNAFLMLGDHSVIEAKRRSMDDLIFPKDFRFGVATAAYQIEGAYNEDGRGMSIWDIWSHIPGKIYMNQTGDVADDHYHKVKEDVELMKYLGVKNYRMSISWSRLIPTGLIKDGINQKGIDHYDKEINTLVNAGINVAVTLYHWDLPQHLQDLYGGWLNSKDVVEAFKDYADLCFAKFGDRVKDWITFNEPFVTSVLGYGNEGLAPGSSNSSTAPYLATHSQLLSHAVAVKVYRDKYQKHQNGRIGIALNSNFFYPLTNTQADYDACERALQFGFGWFADPVFFGDYPQVMKDFVEGGRLPQFTPEQKKLLKGSVDFIGLNHYTSNYIGNRDTPLPPVYQRTFNDDQRTIGSSYKNGVPIGPMADSDWLYVYAPGIRSILNWIQHRYQPKMIYVTENGVDVPNESEMPIPQALNDTFRQNYIHDYLAEVSKAVMQDGVNVKAYYVWSLMDNFEWANGYRCRFGIVYVDYKSPNLDRHIKNSAKYYSQIIRPYN